MISRLLPTVPRLNAAIAVCLCSAASTGYAATVTVATETSTPFVTTAIAEYETNGATMAGMKITGGFSNGMSETATVRATGSRSGLARGTDFSISQSGDSYFSPFSVMTTGAEMLTSLVFQGQPGDTVFDIVANSFLSLDSYTGFMFADKSNLKGAIEVTFSNPVAVSPDAPMGDLFETMTVNLTGLAGGGLTAGQTFEFRQDTDNVLNPNDIRPGIAPLPASGLLLGGVLLGVALLGRFPRNGA